MDGEDFVTGGFTKNDGYGDECRGIYFAGGFFIGVHTYPLSESQITYLTNSLLDFDFKKECVMVTGGTGIVGSALKEYVEKVGASK